MPAAPGTKERTRRALLIAGIAVLSRDPSAPLNDVATHAGVARSTLHRYFPDRTSLTKAAFALADQEYEAAFTRARTDEDSGLEAFRRLCLELMDTLEVLLWWMTREAEADEADLEDPEVRIAQLIKRGQEDGSIDPAVEPEWAENLLWATLYAVNFAPDYTRLTSTEARLQALRSLLKSLAADPTAV